MTCFEKLEIARIYYLRRFTLHIDIIFKNQIREKKKSIFNENKVSLNIHINVDLQIHFYQFHELRADSICLVTQLEINIYFLES